MRRATRARTNSIGWCACGSTRRIEPGPRRSRSSPATDSTLPTKLVRSRSLTRTRASRRSWALTCSLPEYAGRADDYIHLVCNDMLDGVAPKQGGSMRSARWEPSTPTNVGRCSTRAAAAGLGLRLHGNQLGYGPGVRLAVECGCASVDHCTYLTDADIDALAGSDTVATFLPATDFSTRQPYPDARRVLDAGVSVAHGHRTATRDRATRRRSRSASRSPCVTCT